MVLVRVKPGCRHAIGRTPSEDGSTNRKATVYHEGDECGVSEESFKAFGDKFEVVKRRKRTVKPAAKPADHSKQPADGPSALDLPSGYQELKALAKEQGVEIKGRGKNGAVTKADLLEALGG